MNTLPIYHFDRDTCQYLGAGQAGACQVEPGAYLVPAFATTKEPGSVAAGQAAFFDIDADDWQVRDLAPVALVEVAPAELTLDQRKALLVAAVDLHLDGQAQALGYSSIQTAVSYGEEEVVPKFQLEGRALRRWRSLVYAACYELLAAFEAGDIAEPTVSALIDALPKFEMPAEELSHTEFPPLEVVEAA
jgi:hypothetical protein